MRYYAVALALLTLSPASYLLGADKGLDAQELTLLEGKAERAAMRDQCYLYAQLMRGMGEIASRQLSVGEPGEAAETLAVVERYAGRLDSGLARDTKRVKDAEILMRQTALRLKGALSAAALEDRPAVEHTLEKLDKLESKMMTQIFEK